MISVEAVTKRYGRFTAVDDVTFTAAGRVTGFLGPKRRREIHRPQNGANSRDTRTTQLTPIIDGTFPLGTAHHWKELDS